MAIPNRDEISAAVLPPSSGDVFGDHANQVSHGEICQIHLQAPIAIKDSHFIKYVHKE
jgi:hypothetical protein